MGKGGSTRSRRGRRNRYRLKSERGYLLISTLFFLVFSGLFSQSIIKISGNHLIQLSQLSTAYQAKSALNMSKGLILQEVASEEIPTKGQIKTSVGTVKIKRSETENEYTFKLTLTTNAGTTHSENVSVVISPTEEESEETDVKNEETEDSEEEVVEEEKEVEETEETDTEDVKNEEEDEDGEVLTEEDIKADEEMDSQPEEPIEDEEVEDE